MKSFVHIFEIIICMNLLFLVGAIFTKKILFSQKPSYQLYLARLLFMSCILSPIAVQVVNLPRTNLANIATSTIIKKTIHHSIKNNITENINDVSISIPSKQSVDFTYLYSIIILIFMMGFLYRTNRFVKDINKTKAIINSAELYKKHGKVIIKISMHCLVPFSIRFVKSSYIVLPISILHSSINTKLAIAHEGQHHRQGDCLWAYLIELTRIIFWFNPAIKYWHQHFQELQELACDEALVTKEMVSTYEYGSCLFNVTQSVLDHLHDRRLACTSQMISGYKNKTSLITRRIMMLPKYNNDLASKSTLASVLAVSVLSIVVPIGAAYAAKELVPQNITANSINASSINPTFQHIAAIEITNAVNLSQAKSGALIIADARTGEIVAFAEAGKSSKNNSWRSRVFNPASTIKPFIAAAAIDSGIATASTTYDCHGPYQVDGKHFKNSNPDIGRLSLADAMASSNNICMIKMAEATGSTKTRQILTRFGFDINAAWDNKNSDELNLAYTTIGSSIPVTLKSLTNAFTILANKGHSIQSNSSNAVSEKTATTVTKLLEKAVTDGTGKRAALTNVSVAGKTGTLSNDAYTSSLALFAGYAPSNSPRYVSIVVIENARVNGSLLEANGGNVAAPVFHNTLEKILLIPN